MKTNYVGHEGIYQRRRAEGQVGWDATEAGYSVFKTHVERIMARGNAPQSGRLLELGCGAGNMTVWFAQKGYKACGIDIAPTAIDWAKERAENDDVQVELTVGSVVTLRAYPDCCFDFVFDGHCLHCIIGEDRAKLLESVWRVLRPGGYIMINTMCAPVNPERLEGYDPVTLCTFFGDVPTRYFGEADDILAEITAAKFEVIRYDFGQDEADQVSRDLVVEARKPTQESITQHAAQDEESAAASSPPVS